MGVSLTVKKSVAKKFMKYLSDNMIMPDTRSKLEKLYLETFRPDLDDTSEKRVSFGALLFCLKILGFIEPANKGEKERITYSDGLAVVLRGLKEKLLKQRERLTQDKGNICIIPSSTDGIIDMGKGYTKETMEIKLNVANTSERNYFFGCVVLGSATDFNVSNSKYEFMGTARQISSNETLCACEAIDIPVSICEENPGKFHVAVAFWFKSGKGKPFHILKFIKVEVSDAAVESMQPESPYKKRKKSARREPAIRVVKGERLLLPRMKCKVRLEEYPVPKQLMKAMNKDEREYLLPTFWGTPGNGRTSVEVHCKRLSTLLHVEELQMNLDIRNYDIEKATFCTREKNAYLALNVPGLIENRPSLVRGDRLYARKLLKDGRAEDHEYEGFIHQIRLNEVWLKFDAIFHRDFVPNASFAVRFAFFRTWLRLMHRALATVGPYLEQIPFDGRSPRESNVSAQPLRFYDRKVERNEEQKQAVENIVAGTSLPCPYLVFGPPGTGKTVTIVEAIKQVLQTFPQSKVLACAPSNSAADLMLERVAQHNVVPKKQMIRLNAFSRQKLDVNPDILEFCKMDDKGTFLFPPRDEIIRDYRLVVSTLISAGRLVSMGIGDSHFSHVFIDEAGQGMEPECFVPIAGLLKTTGSKVGQLVLAGDPKQLGPIIRSPLTTTKVTNAKLNFDPDDSKLLCLRKGDEIKLVDKEVIADSMLYGMVESNEGYFPAKYATSIEESPKAKFDFAPKGTPQLLCFKKGDVIRVENQDQIAEGMLYGKTSGKEGYFPTKCVAEIEHGLDISFLERLMSPQFPCYNRQPGSEPGQVGSYNARMVTKLLNNYRSHPAIIKVPNECFYENELRTCADEALRQSLCHWDGLPNKGFPVIFEGVCGGDVRENTSPSFFNPEEAAIVLRYVKELKNARGIPLKMEEIGIISPYHKQVQKIRRCLQKKPHDIRDIKVGSVEEFQGQERKVIIISTVRSSVEFFHLDASGKLGFVDNPKRFNVAVTRAKALLIVVGNPHVLSLDKNWRKLIGFCQENGSYKGCAFEMPEVDNEYFKRQLNHLGLDNETTGVGDHEDQEWRPPQD